MNDSFRLGFKTREKLDAVLEARLKQEIAEAQERNRRYSAMRRAQRRSEWIQALWQLVIFFAGVTVLTLSGSWLADNLKGN